MPSVYSVVKKGSRNDSCFTLFFLSRSFAGMHIASTAGYSSFFLYFVLRHQMPVLFIFFMDLHFPALHVLLQLPVYSYFLRFKDWQYDKSGRRKFGGLRKFRSNRTAFHRPSLLNQADPDFIISGSKFRSRFLKDGTCFGSHCFSIGIGGGKRIT